MSKEMSSIIKEQEQGRKQFKKEQIRQHEKDAAENKKRELVST